MRNEINPITLKTKKINRNALKKTTINYTKLLCMPIKRALFLQVRQKRDEKSSKSQRKKKQEREKKREKSERKARE